MLTADVAAVSLSSPRWRTLAILASALMLMLITAAALPVTRITVGILLIALVAYANGSNDVSKAIATLVGSGVTNYRRAVQWGTLMTVLGALLSAATGAALVKTFSSGLLVPGAAITPAFAIGAVVGTAAWVGLSSRVGLPVSTTHALTGSILVTGAVALGTQSVKWVALRDKVAVPLLTSPLIALVLAVAVILVLKVRRGRGWAPVRGLHWISSGATSAARGLNDAPKLAGLGALLFLAIQHSAPTNAQSLALAGVISVAMGFGSYIGGRRVTETLARKVTRMDDREGTASNVVTSFLVTLAAVRGLPVSTTHVSSGSIIGIGAQARDGRLNLSTVRDMILAWAITLPAAGLLAISAWALMSTLARG